MTPSTAPPGHKLLSQASWGWWWVMETWKLQRRHWWLTGEISRQRAGGWAPQPLTEPPSCVRFLDFSSSLEFNPFPSWLKSITFTSGVLTRSPLFCSPTPNEKTRFKARNESQRKWMFVAIHINRDDLGGREAATTVSLPQIFTASQVPRVWHRLGASFLWCGHSSLEPGATCEASLLQVLISKDF